jgi:cell pole-organizing protein PopZ
MRQEGEPSVEEILESIKQVIARDNRAEAADERQRRETIGHPAIFETDAAHTKNATTEAKIEEGVLDLAADSELTEETDQELANSSAFGREKPLVSDDARMSMQDSLAALAMLAEPGARPQIVRSGETSLEALTRELLRPALAEWLEKNLPAIVERLVAAEVARIAGKRG